MVVNVREKLCMRRTSIAFVQYSRCNDLYFSWGVLHALHRMER